MKIIVHFIFISVLVGGAFGLPIMNWREKKIQEVTWSGKMEEFYTKTLKTSILDLDYYNFHKTIFKIKWMKHFLSIFELSVLKYTLQPTNKKPKTTKIKHTTHKNTLGDKQRFRNNAKTHIPPLIFEPLLVSVFSFLLWLHWFLFSGLTFDQ